MADAEGLGRNGLCPDWLRPDWPAPAQVHALCRTRAGGVSTGAFASMNLGAHVGDAPEAVAINRERLQAALQHTTPGARPVFLNQVHGASVLELESGVSDGACADAAVTSRAGMACTIMVADCLPVLITDRQGRAVAAAHAGWRGLAGTSGQGVLESFFRSFEALALIHQAQAAIKKEAKEAAPSIASGTLAWLGPCIGPTAFEVGAEVRAAFCDAPGALGAAAAQCFVARPDAPGKYLCDLAGLARLRLQAMGITAIYGNDSTAPWCTVTQASRFFSHRRDSVALGGSGRFAACIWRG